MSKNLMSPTPPIELEGTGSQFDGAAVEVPEEVLTALAETCETITTPSTVAEASRDWWPMALHWSLAGKVPQMAEVVVRPTTTAEVVSIVKICNMARMPLTVTGGRSGVTGASAPVFGGVVLDATALVGVVNVDEVSGVIEVLAGTFGPDLEDEIQSKHGLSIGHFPQSFDLATVGGWVASRGAGQYSTRYGKIEDMVIGLEVVTGDGTVIHTGGSPAAATGPDLTQLILGSEGTLGVITRVWLRAHQLPAVEKKAAYTFPTFADGVEACRSILQLDATPAVLRLYDAEESARGQQGNGTECILLVLDEGDVRIVDATLEIVSECCAANNGTATNTGLVDSWLGHRNDTSALQGLTRKGYVVDTMEIAAPWSALGQLFETVRRDLLAVPHAVAATCHLSHSYLDGACLYFTFAATPPPEEIESTYIALWDAGQRSVLNNGGNLSHHHGVGINRARFMAESLGPAHDVLTSIKAALDPNGIMNPGKLAFPSPFGAAPWP